MCPFVHVFPCCTEIMKKYIFSDGWFLSHWYLSLGFIPVMCNYYSPVWNNFDIKAPWVLFVVTFPPTSACEPHVPEYQETIRLWKYLYFKNIDIIGGEHLPSIYYVSKIIWNKKVIFSNSFIPVTVAIIFVCQYWASCSEVNSKECSEFECRPIRALLRHYLLC